MEESELDPRMELAFPTSSLPTSSPIFDPSLSWNKKSPKHDSPLFKSTRKIVEKDKKVNDFGWPTRQADVSSAPSLHGNSSLRQDNVVDHVSLKHGNDQDTSSIFSPGPPLEMNELKEDDNVPEPRSPDGNETITSSQKVRLELNEVRKWREPLHDDGKLILKDI